MLDLKQYYRLKSEFFQKHDYSGTRTALLVPLTIEVHSDKCYCWPTGFVLDQALCKFTILTLSRLGFLPPLVADYNVKAVRLAKDQHEAFTLWNDMPLSYEAVVVTSQYLPPWSPNAPNIATVTATAVPIDSTDKAPAIILGLKYAGKLNEAFKEYGKQLAEVIARKRKKISVTSIFQRIPAVTLKGQTVWAYVGYSEPKAYVIPLV